MLLVNSGCAGTGSQSRPLAKMRACTTWMISSMSSGRPLNTIQATAMYSTAASAMMATDTKSTPSPATSGRGAGRSAPAEQDCHDGADTKADRGAGDPAIQQQLETGDGVPAGNPVGDGKEAKREGHDGGGNERRVPSARGPAVHVVRLGGKRLKRTIWKKAATPSFQPIFLPSA